MSNKKAISLKDRVLAYKLESYFIKTFKDYQFINGVHSITICDLYPHYVLNNGKRRMVKDKYSIIHLKKHYEQSNKTKSRG